MGVTRRFILQLRQPGYIYLFLVCLAGALLFGTTNNLSTLSYSLTEWVLIYAFAAAVLILDHYTFQLPPDGNGQSMDSAVYLAVVFVFGGSFSLFILLICSVIFILYKRSIKWWKHLLNFSMYTLMIVGANFTYRLLGGEAGAFDIKHISA
jgi:hypothetical protein